MFGLEKLNINSLLANNTQKTVVGVALTPGLGLEAAIYDRTKNAVVNYGRRRVEYNFSTREIQDYTQFKSELASLMDELKVPAKTAVYIVLPNVYFDFIEVPPAIAETEIRTALLSKAEDFYLFKKEEPASGWAEVINPNGMAQKRLVYSSIQRDCVEGLKEIVADIGLQLVGVESSYSATLRGLYLTGQIDDCIMEGASWTAMLINTNSYTLFNFDGKNLLECNEVPLAIKSFSAEEAYAAVVSNASQLLDNFESTRLYIISQTDDICADVLKQQIQYDKEIIAIDSNRYSKRPIFDVDESDDFNAANSLTLSVVAASCIRTQDFNLTLNTMSDDPAASLGVYFTTTILGQTVDVTTELISKVAVLLAILIGIILGSIVFVLHLTNTSMQNNIGEITSQIENVDAQIAQESDGADKQEINMNALIDELVQMNVSAMNYYDAIATDIPGNIWLTRYYSKDGSKLAIQGIAESIIDIYEYYKNLKFVSPDSNIKLTELKVITGNSDDDKYLKSLAINTENDRLYSFEISNVDIKLSEVSEKANTAPDYEAENTIIHSPLEQTSSQMKPTN